MKIVYEYFGEPDSLKMFKSNKNKKLRLKLKRNFSCDETFDKDASSKGFMQNGSIIKVNHYENLGGLEEIEKGKSLPCYFVSEK